MPRLDKTKLVLTVYTTPWPYDEGFVPEVTVVVVASALTTSFTVPEPAWKLLSPLYCAVIKWAPTASVLVESDAALFERLTVPNEVEPSRKVTVPVGVPLPENCNAVVRVTLWPNCAALGLADTLVVVEAWVMVTDALDELLPVQLLSPE